MTHSLAYYALRVKAAREEFTKAEVTLFMLKGDLTPLPELELAEQEFQRAERTLRSDEQWLAEMVLEALETVQTSFFPTLSLEEILNKKTPQNSGGRQ